MTAGCAGTSRDAVRVGVMGGGEGRLTGKDTASSDVRRSGVDDDVPVPETGVGSGDRGGVVVLGACGSVKEAARTVPCGGDGSSGCSGVEDVVDLGAIVDNSGSAVPGDDDGCAELWSIGGSSGMFRRIAHPLIPRAVSSIPMPNPRSSGDIERLSSRGDSGGGGAVGVSGPTAGMVSLLFWWGGGEPVSGCIPEPDTSVGGISVAAGVGCRVAGVGRVGAVGCFAAGSLMTVL